MDHPKYASGSGLEDPSPTGKYAPQAISFDELTLRETDDYVDITDILFTSLNTITEHQVVKSKYFDLLEGTRAVEIDNAKLDTGMLGNKFTEAELTFDPSHPQSTETIIAISDKLYGLLMSWLNNSSLPVTILSCRYVQTLLQNYGSSRVKSLAVCSLYDRRLKRNAETDVQTSSFEYLLVHKVLRAFIIGLCKYIGFIYSVGTNVLYEEEDLTTRNMDLDFLSALNTDLVLKEIREVIDWLHLEGKRREEEAKIENLIDRLEIVYKLNQIESILLLTFEISQPSVNPICLPFLEDAIHILTNRYTTLDSFASHIPVGAFSKFVQQDLNNKSIPAELYELDSKQSYTNFLNMFLQLRTAIVTSSQISNHFQFQTFLEYEISNNMDVRYNVFVRGLYQLFLVRDNKAIMGSKLPITENILTVTQKMMDNLITTDSQILDLSSWPDLKENVKQEVLTRFDLLLADLESIMYHTISNSTNNRCRQRQLMSRGLLIWDTVQVASENFELDSYEKYNIGDELSDGQPSLPISSFVYFKKLQLMIDILFMGFELNLYKTFEVPQIYWYISYLSQLLLEHLRGRIRSQIESKMNYINSGINKKIKKLKAGDRKERLKQLQIEKQTNVVPKLRLISKFNEQYLGKLYEGYFKLTDAIRMYFIILHSLGGSEKGIIDLLKGPKSKLTSLENIYNLRMKPFSSIGVPNLLTFQQYKSSIQFKDEITNQKLEQLYTVCSGELREAKSHFESVLAFVESDEDSSHYFVQGGQGTKQWIRDLLKSCSGYSEEVKKLETIIGTDWKKEGYKLVIEEGAHIYFPKIFLQKSAESRG